MPTLSKIGLLGTLHWALSLAVLCSTPERATALECADYAPERSPLVRQVTWRTPPDMVILGDLLITSEMALFDLSDPMAPVQLPTEHQVEYWPNEVILADGDVWAVVPGRYREDDTYLYFIPREEIAGVQSRPGSRIRGRTYASGYSNGELHFANTWYNAAEHADSWDTVTLRIREPETPTVVAPIFSQGDGSRTICDLFGTSDRLWCSVGRTLQARSTLEESRGQVLYSINLGSSAGFIAADSTRAFVTDEGGVVQAVSLGAPGSFTLRGQIALPDDVVALSLDGNRLLATLSTNGVGVIDVSNMDDMRLNSHWGQFRPADGLTVKGNYAYVLSDQGVSQVHFGEEPLTPSPYLVHGHTSFWRKGDLLSLPEFDMVAVASSGTLSLERVDGMGKWARLGEATSGSPSALERLGEHLYVATYGVDSFVFDKDGSLDLVGIAHYDTQLTDLEAIGEHLYALDPKLGLVVFDISDRNAPSLSTTVDLGRSEWVQISEVDERLFVLSRNQILVLSFDDPGSPQILGRVDLPSYYGAQVISDSRLILARLGPFVDLFDFNGVDALRARATLSTDTKPTSLALNGDVLYIGTEGNGLRAFEISDLDHPTDLGMIGVPDGVLSVEAHANLVVSLSTRGMRTHVAFLPSACADSQVPLLLQDFHVLQDRGILVVSAMLSETVLAGQLRVVVREEDGESQFYQLRLEGTDLLYRAMFAAPQTDAELTLELSDGSTWVALASRRFSPTPVAETYLRWSSHESDLVSIHFGSPDRVLDLSVFDLRGRLVAHLPSTTGPGEQTVLWERSNTARGVYLVRLRTESLVISKKIPVR